MEKQKFTSRRFHFILDAHDCDTPLLSDKFFIIELIKKIAKLIDMKILKGPIVAKGIPQNPGLSAFAIVDFSHISIHTFTACREFCLDVFSCKPFNYQEMENYIKKVFKIKDKQILKSIVKYGK